MFVYIEAVKRENDGFTFQVQQSKPGTGAAQYSGPIDVAKQLYRQGGIRSVYRGTFATLLRGQH